jgi:hypothetical protein
MRVMTVLFAPRLTHRLRLPGGEHVTVRPAYPGDAEILQSYIRGLSATSRYNRFFGPLRELPPAELDRATDMLTPSTVSRQASSSERSCLTTRSPRTVS